VCRVSVGFGDYLDQFPHVLLLKCLSNLRVNQLCCLAVCNKHFNQLVNDREELWSLVVKVQGVEEDWKKEEQKSPGFWRKLALTRCVTTSVTIGNTHSWLNDSKQGQNQHSWEMFINQSPQNVIHQVCYQLHQTFHPNKIVIDQPPFTLRRLGWGTFSIACQISFKPEYRKKELLLRHNLSFNSERTQQSYIFDFRRDSVQTTLAPTLENTLEE